MDTGGVVETPATAGKINVAELVSQSDDEGQVQLLKTLDTGGFEQGWMASDESVADKTYRAVSLLLQIPYSTIIGPQVTTAVRNFLGVMTGIESAVTSGGAPAKLSIKQREIVARSAREASKQALAGEYILYQEMNRRIDLVKTVLLLRVNIPQTILGLIEGFSLYFQNHAAKDSAEKRKSMEDVLGKVAPLVQYPSPAFKVLIEMMIPRQGAGSQREMPLEAALVNIEDNHTALVEVLSRLISIKAPTSQYKTVFAKAKPDARIQLVIAIISSASLDHSKCLSLLKSLDSSMRPQEEQILLTMVRSMQNLVEVDQARVRQFVVATRRLLLLSCSRDVLAQERLITLITVWHLQLSFQAWKKSANWTPSTALASLNLIFASSSALAIGLPLDLNALGRLTQFIVQNGNRGELRSLSVEVVLQLTKLMFVGSLSMEELGDEKLLLAANIFRQLQSLRFVDQQNDEQAGQIQVLLVVFMSLTEGIFNRIIIDQDRQLDPALSALLTRSVTFSYGPCSNPELPLQDLRLTSLAALMEVDRTVCLGSRLRSFQYFRTLISQPQLVEGRCFLEAHTDPDWVTKVVRKGDISNVLQMLEAGKLSVDGCLYALVVRPGVALTDDIASKLCTFVQQHPRKSELLNSEKYMHTLGKLSHNLRVLGSRGVKAAALLNLSLPKVANFDGRWSRLDSQTKSGSSPNMILSIDKTVNTSKGGSFRKREPVSWPRFTSGSPTAKRRRSNEFNFDDLSLGPGFDAELMERLRQGGDIGPFLNPLCGDVAISAVLRNGRLEDWLLLIEHLPESLDPKRTQAILRNFLERIQNMLRDDGAMKTTQSEIGCGRSLLLSLTKGKLSKANVGLIVKLLASFKNGEESMLSILKSDSWQEVDPRMKATLVLHHPDELTSWRSKVVDGEIILLDPLEFHGPNDDEVEQLIKSLLSHAPAIGISEVDTGMTAEAATRSLTEKPPAKSIFVFRLIPLLLKPVESMIRFHSSNKASRGGNLDLFRNAVQVLKSLESVAKNHPKPARSFVQAALAFLLAEGRAEFGIPAVLWQTTIDVVRLAEKVGAVDTKQTIPSQLATVAKVMSEANKGPDVVSAIRGLLTSSMVPG